MSYLPKVISSEPHRVNSLLIETITLLCRNGLSFTKQLKIEGMIAITVDDSEIALIHINEFLHPNSSSPVTEQHCSKNKSSLLFNKSVGENVECPEFSQPANTFSVEDVNSSEGTMKSNLNNKEFIVESPFLFNSESPSDEDEKTGKVESAKREEQLSDLGQGIGHCEVKQGFDASNSNEKSGNSEKLQLEISHIKCETIDITDEEECDQGSHFDSRIDRRLSCLEGIYGNNCQLADSIFQRGINNTRAFSSREPGPNDTFNLKSSDDFLVSMNLDEHALVSEHLPRLREDVGWQGHSRYTSSMADNDYDPSYQFIPRKRMVGSVDNRPYACPVEGCDRRFFHRNNVYRHRKQKHPLEVSFKT